MLLLTASNSAHSTPKTFMGVSYKDVYQIKMKNVISHIFFIITMSTQTRFSLSHRQCVHRLPTA